MGPCDLEVIFSLYPTPTQIVWNIDALKLCPMNENL